MSVPDRARPLHEDKHLFHNYDPTNLALSLLKYHMTAVSLEIRHEKKIPYVLPSDASPERPCLWFDAMSDEERRPHQPTIQPRLSPPHPHPSLRLRGRIVILPALIEEVWYMPIPRVKHIETAQLRHGEPHPASPQPVPYYRGYRHYDQRQFQLVQLAAVDAHELTQFQADMRDCFLVGRTDIKAKNGVLQMCRLVERACWYVPSLRLSVFVFDLRCS
ncbi:hypothetical protein D9619_008790 [Psilocybe cf. subviscida]|uniref:Uncharacterized protein n=1 Tax=Psilocybe cf. subviscida TaxID=2480587 RepID=A0A8H5BAA1_9AGAR|nr:hypothetical protein D9619_008790 [Psilocybe cf. subviscida]